MPPSILKLVRVQFYTQVTKRAQAARQKMIEARENEREEPHFRNISVVSEREKNMGKVRREGLVLHLARM